MRPDFFLHDQEPFLHVPLCLSGRCCQGSVSMMCGCRGSSGVLGTDPGSHSCTFEIGLLSDSCGVGRFFSPTEGWVYQAVFSFKFHFKQHRDLLKHRLPPSGLKSKTLLTGFVGPPSPPGPKPCGQVPARSICVLRLPEKEAVDLWCLFCN